MAAKNTKKKTTKAPLKKSAMKRVHGGAGDSASGIDSTTTIDPMPPILIHKPLGSTSGSELHNMGVTGASRAGSRR